MPIIGPYKQDAEMRVQQSSIDVQSASTLGVGTDKFIALEI